MATIEDFILRFKTQGTNEIKEVSGTINNLKGDIAAFGEVGGPFGNTINGIVGKLGPLGAAASVVGVAFVGLGAKALQMAGDLADIAGATGIAASQLDSLKSSLIEAGGKADDFGQIASKLNQSVQEAAGGNENLQKAFRTLGVFVTDANGKVRNTGDILQDITARFQRGELSAAQYNAAIDILGKNINKLDLAKLKALRDPVVDADIERLDKYNEAIDKIRIRLEKGIITFFGSVAEQADKAFLSIDRLYNYQENRERKLNEQGMTIGGRLRTEMMAGLNNLFPRDMTEEEKKVWQQTGMSPAGFQTRQPPKPAAPAPAAPGPGAAPGGKPAGGFGVTPDSILNAQKESRRRAIELEKEAEKQGQLLINQERLDALMLFADKSQAAELKLDAQIREININRDSDIAKARRDIYDKENLSKKEKDAEYAAARKEIMTKAEVDIAKARSRSVEELTRETERIQSLITQSKARVEEEQRINDLLEEKLFFNISNADATDKERERAQQLLDIENERARVLRQIKQIKDLPPEEIARREREVNAVFDERRRITENQQKIDQQQQQSFSKGFEKAFREYSESARNNFNTAQRIFEKTTQGMEDAIVNFAKTGKFEFKDFLNTVLEELLRSQIRSLIAQTFGGIGGGGSVSGGLLTAGAKLLGFANGGIIPTNGPVLVGERGPEIISGASGRVVTPNDQLGGTSVVYNINAVDAMSFKQMLARDPSFLYAVAEQGRRKLPGGRV